MPAPSVFIDSSVLIAASISSREYARDLIVAGLTGRVALCLTSFVLDETERNLSRKAPAAIAGFRQLIAAEPFLVIHPTSDQVQSIAEEIAQRMRQLSRAPLLEKHGIWRPMIASTSCCGLIEYTSFMGLRCAFRSRSSPSYSVEALRGVADY